MVYAVSATEQQRKQIAAVNPTKDKSPNILSSTQETHTQPNGTDFSVWHRHSAPLTLSCVCMQPARLFHVSELGGGDFGVEEILHFTQQASEEKAKPNVHQLLIHFISNAKPTNISSVTETYGTLSSYCLTRSSFNTEPKPTNRSHPLPDVLCLAPLPPSLSP